MPQGALAPVMPMHDDWTGTIKLPKCSFMTGPNLIEHCSRLADPFAIPALAKALRP